jgi:hypothetical protein
MYFLPLNKPRIVQCNFKIADLQSIIAENFTDFKAFLIRLIAHKPGLKLSIFMLNKRW